MVKAQDQLNFRRMRLNNWLWSYPRPIRVNDPISPISLEIPELHWTWLSSLGTWIGSREKFQLLKVSKIMFANSLDHMSGGDVQHCLLNVDPMYEAFCLNKKQPRHTQNSDLQIKNHTSYCVVNLLSKNLGENFQKLKLETFLCSLLPFVNLVAERFLRSVCRFTFAAMTFA